MARHEHLPIYKAAMDLAVLMEESVRGFPRYHKYAIGKDLRDLSKELLYLIMEANSQREKKATLNILRNKGERMKAIIQIGKEIKAFQSLSRFQQAADLAVGVCRQTEGWLKSQTGKGSS